MALDYDKTLPFWAQVQRCAKEWGVPAPVIYGVDILDFFEWQFYTAHMDKYEAKKWHQKT